MRSQKWKIVNSVFGILTAIILGFLAILTKTHLAFGGDYFSTKNIKITIGIILVISIILIGASVIDYFDKDQNIEKTSKDKETKNKKS